MRYEAEPRNEWMLAGTSYRKNVLIFLYRFSARPATLRISEIMGSLSSSQFPKLLNAAEMVSQTERFSLTRALFILILVVADFRSLVSGYRLLITGTATCSPGNRFFTFTTIFSSAFPL